MADWRQIQARIRKAKTSADPVGQLAELFERTRDAMVAFELGQFSEKAGQNSEAVRWFTTAAERFRRAQWKTKAEEALTRLGAPLPSPAPSPSADDLEVSAAEAEGFGLGAQTEPFRESRLAAADSGRGATHEPEAPASEATGSEGTLGVKKRRRRGRRGGRGRRRKTGAAQAQPAVVSVTQKQREPSPREAPPPRVMPSRPFERTWPAERAAEPQREEETPHRAAETPRVHEAGVGSVAWQARGRAGEPALASRLAQLESQLRRLLACQPYSVDEADVAPAGPGVFVLSDSDQITYYYIEACQTLRVGVGNLLRGERSRRGGGDSLRSRFAEHLGITDARVSKYLREHCAVRWLQLDEGASLLAHFAIAVLRPALND